MDDLKILCFKGKDIAPYIHDLAKLRIKVFRDYPYLYDGNFEYETSYLQTYVNCPESVLVIAFDKENVIGISTSIPLEFETIEFQKPFLDHHLPIKDIFYLGESLLLPAYRGKGIYKHFFSEREAAARAYGCKITTFAAVERPDNHPRKPKDYVTLDSIWNRFGYKKHPELCAHFEWQDLDETSPSFKPLMFWMKTL